MHLTIWWSKADYRHAGTSEPPGFLFCPPPVLVYAVLFLFLSTGCNSLCVSCILGQYIRFGCIGIWNLCDFGEYNQGAGRPILPSASMWISSYFIEINITTVCIKPSESLSSRNVRLSRMDLKWNERSCFDDIPLCSHPQQCKPPVCSGALQAECICKDTKLDAAPWDCMTCQICAGHEYRALNDRSQLDLFFSSAGQYVLSFLTKYNLHSHSRTVIER